MNKVEWNLKALREIKTFPEEIRKELGYLIYKLQLGQKLKMPYSKAMPSIRQGSYELRMKGRDGTYRAFYYLKVREVIFIFHAFQKKAKKTPKREIEIGRKNIQEMLDEKN